MKTFKLFLPALAICSVSTLFAQQENDIRTSPKIDLVTVYLNGAEVKHNASVHLKSGDNKVVLTGLSPYLESKSVQVSLEGDAEVQSVSSEVDYLSEESINPKIKQLKDSIQLLKLKLRSLVNQVDAYASEKSMLEANKHCRYQPNCPNHC